MPIQGLISRCQYQAPQTEDGWIKETSHCSGGPLTIEIEFAVANGFQDKLQSGEYDLCFVGRSRIARLGINVKPLSEIEFDEDRATLTASVRSVVHSFNLHDLLPSVFLRELRVGRLVLLNAKRRLDSEQVFDGYKQHLFQLPEGFSIDTAGQVNIPPHRLVYEFQRQLTEDDLFTILARSDGKDFLNRLQIAKEVEHIELPSGDGVITSCTMYLHRHFVVLETGPTSFGQHTSAVLLDPVSTRGSRVYLELFNESDQPIINPSTLGSIYSVGHPDEMDDGSRSSIAYVGGNGRFATNSRLSYKSLEELYGRAAQEDSTPSYYNRPVAIVDSDGDVDPEQVEWHRPSVNNISPVLVRAAPAVSALERSELARFGTRALHQLADDTRATVLLRYFPNLLEHLDIMAAAAKGKIKRLCFQLASFEHGPFLSARDHGRLADYHDLGIEVDWFNDERGHLVTHRYRGHRGFFCRPEVIDRFDAALLIAVYGSAQALSDPECEKLRSLIEALRDFFGQDLAIITGGGFGTMKQASDVGKSLDLLVGASYLEIEDQDLNLDAEFYQVFQDSSRHNRQRWFEIASFQIFCIGGLGTYEEIGMTLTDMKLSVLDRTPIVFFGRRDNGKLYWRSLGNHLNVLVAEKRGPEWLDKNVLVSDDPRQVIDFYREVLRLG